MVSLKNRFREFNRSKRVVADNSEVCVKVEGCKKPKIETTSTVSGEDEESFRQHNR